ncbi:hypothetical protein ACSS6W_003245 [Trichoderma asperelloides]
MLRLLRSSSRCWWNLQRGTEDPPYHQFVVTVSPATIEAGRRLQCRTPSPERARRTPREHS